MKVLRNGSRGIQVSYLQTLLKNLALYKGNIDGIFGNNTENAVISFQRNATINESGIVDEATWNALVPYATVPTTTNYSYDIMMLNIQRFILRYPFLNIGNIGTSVMDKEIPYIQIGFGPNKVLYVGSTHANEWITSTVLMKFIEDFSNSYLEETTIFNNISAKEIYESSSITIVPMLNPDGVDLVTGDLDTLSDEYIDAKNISINYPAIPFPNGWKANISRNRFKLAISSRVAKSKRNKIQSRIYKSCAKRFCR